MAIVLKRVKTSPYDTVGTVVLDTTLLEAGDQVALLEGHWSEPPSARFLTVERVTATQIIMRGNPQRYRRDNGSKVGDSWSPALHWVQDPMVLDALARAEMRDLVRATESLIGKPPRGARGCLSTCVELEELARNTSERLGLLVSAATVAAAEMEAVA